MSSPVVPTITDLREPEAAAPKAPATHFGFRPDIEGLRAVAVTLVVLSHSGVALFAGGYVGVDVFFVISGFLITTLLRKELVRRGTISLPGFYARRVVRLLPVSTVVLVATLLASWLWMPVTRFHSIAQDALFSTFYGINWRLAAQGTDYLNAAAAPSPLQHLWSLAVEEQFYLVWPLLLLAVGAGRRAWIALSALVVLSLALSVQQTAASAPWAYFGSYARAWELGIGALVALGSAALARTPKALAAVLTWGGLAAVLVAAVVFDDRTAFPGSAALLPVLGAAAIIAGGTSGARWGAGSLLGTGPFQLIGKLSYGWYLWHWPVLMIWPEAFVRNPTPMHNLFFAGCALALAFVTYHLVENPVRNRPWLRARPRRGLALGLSLSGGAAVLALIWGQFTPPLPSGPAAIDTVAVVAAAPNGADQLSKLITESIGKSRMPKNMTPRVEKAGDESPKIYADQCHFNYQQTLQDRQCLYGDPNGTQTMYLIGDSHAAQWFPTVDAVAQAHHWRLIALTKAACQIPVVLTYNTALKRAYTECMTWREQTLQRIVKDKPDLVVMASNDLDNGGMIDEKGQPISRVGLADDAIWVQDWQKTWDRLKGIPMVLLQDTPWPSGVVPECAAKNPKQLFLCNRPVKKAIAEPNRRQLVADAARQAGLKVVDPAPWFCTKTCPVVIGNVLVFKDNSHMTPAFARVLIPLLDRAIFS